MKRREFLKITALSGTALMLSRKFAWAYGQSPRGLKKFIQPLPGLGPTGVPVAVPDTATYPGCDYYQIRMGEFEQQLHPDLPATKLWGYADVTGGRKPNHRYLGGLIVAQKDRPVRITFKNRLPATHPLPVDTTLMGAEPGQAVNRASVHFHGGHVPWISDGGPFAWFAPDGTHGPSLVNIPDMPAPAAGNANYYYPNDQTSRLGWYHDHALGITRLNAYAGLATGYLIRDALELSLIKNRIIPSREVPLVIQDKTFFNGIDQNYTWGERGDLFYPYLYEPDSLPGGVGRWEYGPDASPPGAITDPLPVPSVVPEFFCDTILVNGAAYPYLNVEPRHYRFRILNGSQARFYNLQLYYARPQQPGEANLKHAGPRLIQIGSEGGFLPSPVALNNPPAQIGFDNDPLSPTFGNAIRYNLLLAPAERADIVVDFSHCPVGSRLILYSDSPAPFPGGDDRNDYFTGNPDFSAEGGAASTKPNFGPNSRTLMQFRVGPLVGPADPPSLNLLEKIALHQVGGPSPLTEPGFGPAALSTRNAVRVRNLTLNEDFDDLGRLMQWIGTDTSIHTNTQGFPTFGRAFTDDPTETPEAGDIEIWRIFNLTGDTHPIHFHLVNVQVLSRQPFDPAAWDGTPTFTGPDRGPDANEMGWKETVRMNPNECTTVMMKFDLPVSPFTVPESPRTGGHEYVWHCHILEHEEHDMMRPLVVTP